MSIFDWRIAKKQIQSGYDFQYAAAIEHYSNLKKKMFDQMIIDKSLINDNFYAEIEKNFQRELNELENGVTQKLSSLSYESLSLIQKKVKEAFDDEKGSSVLSELSNKLKALEDNKNLTQKQKKQEIEKTRESILGYFGKGNIEEIAQSALKGYTGQQGDLGVIYSFLYTFVVNTVKWRSQVEASKLFINKQSLTTLIGYYKEIIELKLIRDLFQKMQSNSSDSFKQTNIDLIAGKNTINDIIFSFFDSIEGQTASATENLSVVGELYEKQFGIQIKARDIENVKTAFMKISHQSELSKQFNLNMMSASGRFSKYSWSCSVAFLGQVDNILTSLGENNVMFISGNTRQFMDAFIRNFRSKNMYLAFEFDEQHKATSQVGLQRYIENKGKNRLLARFR